MADGLNRIEKARHWRARRDTTVPLGESVDALHKKVERAGRRIGGLIGAWEEIIPTPLAARTRITGFRGGVAHVVVESPPVLYEIDRLLRGGAEAALRARMTATLTRVRLSIGPLIEPAFSRE